MPSLQDAIQFHKCGQLDQAELLYRNLLDDDPDSAEALHLLGVVLHQRGQSRKAVRFISRAVDLQPHSAVMHCNLAEAYRGAAEFSEAVAHSRRAIQLMPRNADAHNHLGLALQGLAVPEEAVAAYRAAIALQPDFALAHNNLGYALRELNRTDEAEAAFREAIRCNPNLALAHSNLGQLLLEKNRFDEALEHCRLAVQQAPDFAEGLSNLGNVLRAQENLEEAKACYRKALALRPGVAMIHNNLGQALQEEGHLDEAIACYRRGIELDPRSARIHCHLASALAARERPQEAAGHYRRAIELEPGWAEARNGLGHLLEEQGDLDAAFECFEDALRLNPNLAEAHASVGSVLAQRGDLAGAEEAYRRALEFDPEHAGAYGVLATHLRDGLPADDVARMQALLGREHLCDWKRALLHHGLAHVHDARKEYALAGEHAARANAYRWQTWQREGKTYNRDEHKTFVDSLIAQFTPALFERVAGWGLQTEVPVFIVGMPRSGTTLLEQILASHRQMHGAGELTLAKESFESVSARLGQPGPSLGNLQRLTPEAVQDIARSHLGRLTEHSPGAMRIVDKMPDNYLWLGFLATLFPKARFLYSKRDVRDIAVSCWITNFRQIRWSCDLEDIAGRIKAHLRLMDHWRAVLPARLLEVEYEETVADVERAARRMVDFCGLEWDPSCLRFHETPRTVRTASLTQVRQPAYQGSVQRWRRYEAALRPLFDAIEDAGRPV